MNLDLQHQRSTGALLAGQLMIVGLVLAAPSLALLTGAGAAVVWSGATVVRARFLAAFTGGYTLGIGAEAGAYHLAQPLAHPVYQQWVAPMLAVGLPPTTATAPGAGLPNPFMGGILLLQQFLTAGQIETWTIACAVLLLLAVLWTSCSPLWFVVWPADRAD